MQYKINYRNLLAGLGFSLAAYAGLTGYFSEKMGTQPLNEIFFTMIMLTGSFFSIIASFEKRK
jgi:hypothetical protein